MFKGFRIHENASADLSLYQCGIHECKPGYSYGPAIRDHYLLHYVMQGKGNYFFDGNCYPIAPGDIFLICPNVETYYQADQQEPWSYGWVGFHGLKAQSLLEAAGFSSERLVISYTAGNLAAEFQNLVETKDAGPEREVAQLGFFYLIFSKLIRNAQENKHLSTALPSQELYLRKALRHIHLHYQEHLTIQEIADALKISRAYLYTLFKQQFHLSPQSYLIRYRINKACIFMKNPLLTITQISHSVGYPDPLVFSKSFKKVLGMSPKQYIHSVTNTPTNKTQ